MNQGYQLGVDVGGTFTDVYVFTRYSQTVRAKIPTTIRDQSIGIHNGISKAREILKAQFNWPGKFQFIHHDTTTATNAVLEGKGARTALVVTAGHKDILALRRSQISGGLGAWLYFTPPEPIVPQERVVQCKANVGAGRDCHGLFGLWLETIVFGRMSCRIKTFQDAANRFLQCTVTTAEAIHRAVSQGTEHIPLASMTSERCGTGIVVEPWNEREILGEPSLTRF
ncbi:hypothetical protein N7522_001428 [Penicillium canescens]|nr:hypothetical protein N7522_001428 [Penicillium canescens]